VRDNGEISYLTVQLYLNEVSKHNFLHLPNTVIATFGILIAQFPCNSEFVSGYGYISHRMLWASFPVISSANIFRQMDPWIESAEK
jgi:hypothetical protein